MTLYEFNNLTLKEKQAIVWDKGAFLDNYITKDIRIYCYAIDKFFKEVGFKYEHELDKYAPRLD